MQILVVGQRKFGTVRFPPSMGTVIGQDFIPQFIIQRMKINRTDPFGEDRTKAKNFMEKKIHSHCLEIL